jgi:hypothetical protein
MKTTEIIRADISIIPNASYCYEGSMHQKSGSGASFVNQLSKVWYALPEEIRKNKDFKDEEWIQIWYATPNHPSSLERNWFDNTIYGYEDLKHWKPVCGYLPKSIFEGKKEGDCVTIDLPIVKEGLSDDDDPDSDVIVRASSKIKVQLQLAQTKGRYGIYGNFEEVLAKV